jgi:hypothetical protein
MTNKISALTVVLEQPIREDDIHHLISAIAMFKGVLRVAAEVSDLSEFVAETRIKRELTERMWEVLYPKK